MPVVRGGPSSAPRPSHRRPPHGHPHGRPPHRRRTVATVLALVGALHASGAAALTVPEPEPVPQRVLDVFDAYTVTAGPVPLLAVDVPVYDLWSGRLDGDPVLAAAPTGTWCATVAEQATLACWSVAGDVVERHDLRGNSAPLAGVTDLPAAGIVELVDVGRFTVDGARLIPFDEAAQRASGGPVEAAVLIETVSRRHAELALMAAWGEAQVGGIGPMLTATADEVAGWEAEVRAAQVKRGVVLGVAVLVGLGLMALALRGVVARRRAA